MGHQKQLVKWHGEYLSDVFQQWDNGDYGDNKTNSQTTTVASDNNNSSSLMATRLVTRSVTIILVRARVSITQSEQSRSVQFKVNRADQYYT